MPGFSQTPEIASQSPAATLNATMHSKSSEEKQNLNRERDCIVMILAYLRSNGYISTSSELQLEGGNMLSQYEMADNMDLISLFKICEDYYLTKFGKRPIFTRKLSQLSDEKGALSKFRRSSASRRRILQQIPENDYSRGSIGDAIQRKVTSTDSNNTNNGLLVNGKMSLLAPVAIDLSLSSSTEAFKSTVTGTSLNIQKDTFVEPSETKVVKFITESEDSQTVKPFPFGDDSELRNLAAALRHDILQRSPGVEWEDVVELDSESASRCDA